MPSVSYQLITLCNILRVNPQQATAMAYEKVPLEDFKTAFGTQIGSYDHLKFTLRTLTDWQRRTELSSAALGGKVTSVSDDFFVEAYHLLLVEVNRRLILCIPTFVNS